MRAGHYWSVVRSFSFSTTSWAPPSRMLVADTRVIRAVRCRSAMESAPQLHMVDLILVTVMADVVLEASGVGDVGVDAFFEGEAALATDIVALPVACAVGAFAPVFFHEIATDAHLAARAFVKAGEVPALHDEVGAHGQGQDDVVVEQQSAVGADGHVGYRFLRTGHRAPWRLR